MNYLFRPGDYPKSWLIKERRNGSVWGKGRISFQTRSTYVPAGWSKHQSMFAKRFANLHYFACHSPKPIRKKWRVTYNNFMNKYFAQKGNASMRFLNKYTCHSWL